MNRCKMGAAEEPGAEALEILAAAGDEAENRGLKPAEPARDLSSNRTPAVRHRGGYSDDPVAVEMPR